jgi:REP element-mobilizing transposase RayT
MHVACHSGSRSCFAILEFLARLHHDTPGWVKSRVLYHVRIRVSAAQGTILTEPTLSRELLASVQRYHTSGHWWCVLLLLMPDHVHALLAFSREPGMSVVIRNWKRGTARFQGVSWQDNYFDHRLRSLAEEQKTWLYIRRNPVVKGLCASEEDWSHWWSALTPTR